MVLVGGAASPTLWGWTLSSDPTSWRDLHEVWLAESARPGRPAALYVAEGPGGSGKILSPITSVRQVRALQTQLSR